jgi:hypothetical protein
MILKIMRRITGLSILLLFSYYSIAHAAPTISNVSGTVADGQTITIFGSGFGNGPNVVLYDEFEGGVDGETISAAATVGSWAKVGNPTNPTNAPYYDPVAHSGSHSMRAVDSDSSRENVATAKFPDTTEFFQSWWVQVPAGERFPGAGAPGRFPSKDLGECISCFKMTWISENGLWSGGGNDICLGTWVAQTMQFQGNDVSSPVIAYVGNSWWRWGKWMRFSVWFKANGLSNGQGKFRVLAEGEGWTYANEGISGVMMHTSPYLWNTMNVAGWAGGTGYVVYDDYYLATGPNSQARVGIGDAPTYAGSKNIALLTPVSWSDSTITAVVRKGSFSNLSNVFFYVTDANGNVNANGLLGCTQCPRAPTNLAVQ